MGHPRQCSDQVDYPLEPDVYLDNGDLDGYLAALIRRRQMRIRALLDSNGGSHSGICARSERRRAWGVILPEMSDPNSGQARVQRFDQDGFVGHSVCSTFEDALDQLVREGYVLPDPKALDRVLQSA